MADSKQNNNQTSGQQQPAQSQTASSAGSQQSAESGGEAQTKPQPAAAEGSSFDGREKIVLTALGGAAIGALIGFYGSKILKKGEVSWPTVIVAAFGLGMAGYILATEK